MNHETIQTPMLDEAAVIIADDPRNVEVKIIEVGRLRDGSPRFLFIVTGPRVVDAQKAMFTGTPREIDGLALLHINRALKARVHALKTRQSFDYTLNVKEVLNGQHHTAGRAV